jgi:hypothetical protein
MVYGTISKLKSQNNCKSKSDSHILWKIFDWIIIRMLMEAESKYFAMSPYKLSTFYGLFEARGEIFFSWVTLGPTDSEKFPIPKDQVAFALKG